MEKRKIRNAPKRVLLLLLCAMLLQSAAPAGPAVLHAQAAAVKKGLKKEGKYCYYYAKGQRVKNAWKTVKGRKYYFGRNGRAYAAPNMKSQDYTKNIIVKKIGKYSYGFDNKGRMVKSGYYNDPQKYDKNGNTMTYYFNKKGRLQTKQSKAIRKAGDYRADAAAVRAILGEPLREEALNSCFEEDGDDYRLVYRTVTVTIHRYTDGREIVFGIFPA